MNYSDEDLDKRFDRIDKSKRYWYIHNWQNFGSDYGFVLSCKGTTWTISSYQDSGYTPDRPLITFEESSEVDMKKIFLWIECFCPTNKDFVHDS